METGDITRAASGPFKTSAILAIAIALLLASHGETAPEHWSVWSSYAYWLARIFMAFLIIIGAHAALGQVMTARHSPFAHAGLAAALSFVPFVMAVTTMDLLIGDLDLLRTDPNVLLSRIGIEAASLIDNHLATCAILLAPYVLSALQPQPVRQIASHFEAPPDAPAAADHAEDSAEAGGEDLAEPAPGLLLASQPPVIGDILAAEAQEHYVKLKATEQSGMALYRFGDAVRDLERYEGMQIHRSHWVADKAVAAVIGKRGSLKIELTDGEIVPVSRRYELEVEARYGGRGRRTPS